ncbi:MAG: DUF2857 domain-containing protein [Azoarcus sp.]|nr:DUF2857 domain-containing protein [Azoarcus sp.]
MTPHPLNQAVVIQTLHDLRNGQLHRCLDMGFTERELEVLKWPALAALLVHARVPWCTVTVDRNVLGRLIDQAREVEREVTTVDRLLTLGASSEMICQRHGLTHQEVALRRELLGLPGRKGRHPELSDAQEAELWRAWQVDAAERGIAPDEEEGILAWAMERAEAMAVPLAVIWTTLQNWSARESAEA